jgi:hypothetical protein
MCLALPSHAPFSHALPLQNLDPYSRHDPTYIIILLYHNIMTNIKNAMSNLPAGDQVEKKLYQVKKDPSKAEPFPPRYIPPHRSRPIAERLRSSKFPYSMTITDKMLVKGLDYHLPSGLLKPTLNDDEEVEFSNVRYGGGYTWHVPLTKQSLRPDHKALGEKRFTTPGTPTSLR